MSAVAYSNWQSIPFTTLIKRSVITENILVFLANARYEVNINAEIDSYGAGTSVDVNYNAGVRQRIIRFEIGDLNDPPGTVKVLNNVIFDVGDEGAVISKTQSPGSNASMDFVIRYRRTPKRNSKLLSSGEWEARRIKSFEKAVNRISEKIG